MEFWIYLICFGVGLLFTIASALFGHIFGGHDGAEHVGGSGGHAEAGVDASDMPGVSALSPTIISTFITAFGGFGLIFARIEATSAPWASAGLALVGAFATATGVLSLLRTLFRKTQSSSEGRVSTLIGIIATTVSPIPEKGVGEIAYVQAGTRYTAPAREEKGVAVGTGQAVKITRIVGSQFYVRTAE
jgi:membrane protein implicated in regulation of membrane protease activity